MDKKTVEVITAAQARKLTTEAEDLQEVLKELELDEQWQEIMEGIKEECEDMETELFYRGKLSEKKLKQFAAVLRLLGYTVEYGDLAYSIYIEW